MLFITNRFPKQSIRSRRNRNWDFDLDNNGPSNSLFYCEREAEDRYREIGSIELMRRLKESPYRQILLFIHGFSNLPEDVFEKVHELQRLCDAAEEHEALVVPMIWPCDNDFGVVKDYWDDQKSADKSAAGFVRALGKFLDWRSSDAHNPQSDPCLKRINILAHSMGNRVLRETLAEWAKYDLPNGVPLLFRNTFLVAADIVNESLHRGERGEHITHASRNVVVYYASDDLALRASKAANLRHQIASRRLGHSGPEDMQRTPRNVHAVDCDDINTLYDPPSGHTYFLSGQQEGVGGLVFEHIFAAIRAGRIGHEAQPVRTTVIGAGDGMAGNA